MLPNLQALRLMGCQGLGDGACQSIGSHLTALTSLEVHRNSRVSAAGEWLEKG